MVEAALPVAVLQEILAFAHAPALIPVAPSSVSAAQGDFAKCVTEPSTAGLLLLARVCKTWRRATETLLESYETRVLTLHFTVGNEDAQQKEYGEFLKQHGHLVQDLRIHIVVPKQRFWWQMLGTSSTREDDDVGDDDDDDTENGGSADTNAVDTNCHPQWIDWNTLFVYCPHVQRLDLSKVPLHHFGIGDLLDAASRHCVDMQALVMPMKERIYAEAVDATIDETFRALYAAMARWYQPSDTGTGGTRGLLQLTVPSRDTLDHHHTSNQFLTTVTRFCPTIEYLDGWKRSYNDLRFVVSEESLCVSQEVWAKFCATCAHLREFSWVVVPFADNFFLPFGETQKSQLTHLQLTYNAKAPFRIRRSEYSTNGLCAVVCACPKLQALDVILHRIQPSHAFVYPHLDEMIDGEVFNDQFITELVRFCPRLERLRIREVGGGSSLMNSITDHGIQALAGLKCLESVELQGAKCSANGILSLGDDFPANYEVSNKTIKIRELGSQFGEVVSDLLTKLTTGGSTLVHCEKPLMISLSCRRGFVFKKSFLESAFAEMKLQYAHLRFVAVLREKPSANSRDKDGFTRVSIVPSLTMNKNVARVGKLVVYTRRSVLSAKLQEKIAQHPDTCIIQL